MTVSDVLSLFSGVALFLFGMTLMGEGLKKVAGNSLELILYKLTGNPFKGILLGAGVTAVIQSSSATSVMVVGFVNSGMMKIKQAIGVIMGAIIGTSITGWIISLSSIEGSNGVLELLSTDSITAIIAITGIILRMFAKHTRSKHIGDIMMGFAVLMFGMKAMSNSVSGLREMPAFTNFITSFTNPILGIIVGAAFTALIQSASAAVGILQALSSTGTISFSISFPILLGIAIGASVPVILSSLGANSNAKKAAWSYLVIDAIGAFALCGLFYGLNAFIDFGFESKILNTFEIAFINTSMRVIMIILLAPFINQIDKLSSIFVKDDEEDDDRYEEDKLEERFLSHPAIAIEQTRLVINQMAEITRNNIFAACQLLIDYSERGYQRVYNKEDIVDQYADKLGTYIVKITRKELDKTQNRDVSKYLQALADFERISDHAVNIADAAKQVNDEKITFSSEAFDELKTILVAIQDMTTIAVQSFIDNDLDLAFTVSPFEDLIDEITLKMKNNHIDRVRQGNCTLENGIVFNDLLTDLERVADHCDNVAVEMIETSEDSLESHKYEMEIKSNRKADFDRLFTEYQEKYKI